ncbi:hypothetical protein [Variovorax sp. DXTD-1]|uniref:hypothetical protein n=1 Tax=Variovorax sp. DXTD-1 TaxID=2495592 RepID=UPI0021AEE711|nr:hypothetical protein [Variovorax sp. DXTD-1]
MSIAPLDLFLNIGRAHASLNLKLQEELGAFHGLDYEDVTLLHRLLSAEDGCVSAADLARSLGLSISAWLRKACRKSTLRSLRFATTTRPSPEPFNG